MIKQITIRNFLSFEKISVNLKTLNVFIGANNSGKSNFFEALKVIQRIFQGESFDKVFVGRYGFLDWFLYKKSMEERIEFSLQFCPPLKKDKYEYRVSVGLKNGIISTHGEKLVFKNRTSEITLLEKKNSNFKVYDETRKRKEDYTLDEGRSGLVQLLDKRRNKKILSFLDSVKIISFYNLNPKFMKFSRDVESHPILNEDGSNLTSVLDDMKGRPLEFDRFETHLKSIINEAERVGFETFRNRKKVFNILERDFHEPFTSIFLSDGNVRFMAFLTLAYSPNTMPVICFEEPENGLHPRRLKDLIDTITAMSNPTINNPKQIFITTHSPYLLDLVDPENVFIFEKKGGRSEIHSLNINQMEEQLKDFSLGELWSRGSIGGV